MHFLRGLNKILWFDLWSFDDLPYFSIISFLFYYVEIDASSESSEDSDNTCSSLPPLDSGSEVNYWLDFFIWDQISLLQAGTCTNEFF